MERSYQWRKSPCKVVDTWICSDSSTLCASVLTMFSCFFAAVDRCERRKRRNAPPLIQHEEEDSSNPSGDGGFKTTFGRGTK